MEDDLSFVLSPSHSLDKYHILGMAEQQVEGTWVPSKTPWHHTAHPKHISKK
jgi:hypothetical protein